MLVSAGWGQACVARDLLFARALGSGRVFFICAACGAAGRSHDDCGVHISEAHARLAPEGWTLASRQEAESSGYDRRIEGPAPESYAGLISWYPGFRPPSPMAP